MSAQVYFVVSEAHNVPIVSVSALRPAARPPRPTPPADGAKPATANGTDVAANGAPDANGAPPAAGERRRARGQGGRGAGGPGGRTAGDGVHYTVTVLEDGERVQKDIVIGAMNRLVAEVKSGLAPGDVIVMEAPAGGGGQQQRSGGGLLGGAGGLGGGPRFR
jgi:macrolide-specific efflux system membrane fusion protein